MTARGFSLIELLVACALLMIVGGGVAALAGPLRHALARSDAIAQLEPAARGAIEALLSGVRDAGGDTLVADPGFSLASLIPRVRPVVDLGDGTWASPGGAIEILATSGGAVLAAPVAAGSGVLPLETATRCATGPPACGFVVDDEVVVYTQAAAERLTVRGVLPGQLVLAQPLAGPFAMGAALVRVETTRYGTRALPDGSRRLVRITAGGAEQPVLDNVVALVVEADTADPLRVRRVSIRLRLEAAAATLRGPAGRLFQRAGTAVHARQWVPDVEMQFVVALRQGRPL